ncbi:hypothetical protein niasHT_025413 [Heterodera trifolii]|uniref:BPTI/Kunitz inhibitor domain-containing protein n=1 Tax=Heterodera trifolii TaxID=157864 RepID=A0ABD2KEW0_9BILA
MITHRQFGHSSSAASFLLRRIAVLFVLLLLPNNNDGSPRLPGPPIFEAISHYPSICYLPPESGMCPPATNRTTDTDQIKAAGAATVDDSHPTVDEGLADGDDDASQLRHAATPLLTRYYFDAVTAQCYPFGAQTCGGNENRFETKEKCLAKCRIGTD